MLDQEIHEHAHLGRKMRAGGKHRRQRHLVHLVLAKHRHQPVSSRNPAPSSPIGGRGNSWPGLASRSSLRRGAGLLVRLAPAGGPRSAGGAAGAQRELRGTPGSAIGRLTTFISHTTDKSRRRAGRPPPACWHVHVEAALKALFVTPILDAKTDVTEGSSCGPFSFATLHSLRISPRLSGPDSRPPLPGCSMSTGNSVPPTRSCCWASMSRAAPPWSVTGMAGR